MFRSINKNLWFHSQKRCPLSNFRRLSVAYKISSLFCEKWQRKCVWINFHFYAGFTVAQYERASQIRASFCVCKLRDVYGKHTNNFSYPSRLIRYILNIARDIFLSDPWCSLQMSSRRFRYNWNFLTAYWKPWLAVFRKVKMPQNENAKFFKMKIESTNGKM